MHKRFMHKRFGRHGLPGHGPAHGGPDGGRFLRGGPEFRKGKVLSSDDLQLVALQLLSEAPRHGYEIIKAVEEHSSGVYAPSPGMVYPVLTYLEELSRAISEADGNKKLFRITGQGLEHLAQHREKVTAILEMLRRYGEKVAHFQNEAAEEETADERWGGGPGGQNRREWRELKSEYHEVRFELKTSIYEKLNAPLEEKQRVLDVLRRATAEIRGK